MREKSWDISYLRDPVRRPFFHEYLFLANSRRNGVAGEEPPEANLVIFSPVLEAPLDCEVATFTKIVLHLDRRGLRPGTMIVATLQSLAIVLSFCRRWVRDENPFAKDLCRTLKYRPGIFLGPCATIEKARRWVHVLGCDDPEPLHFGIRFVTQEIQHERPEIPDLLHVMGAPRPPTLQRRDQGPARLETGPPMPPSCLTRPSLSLAWPRFRKQPFLPDAHWRRLPNYCRTSGTR